MQGTICQPRWPYVCRQISQISVSQGIDSSCETVGKVNVKWKLLLAVDAYSHLRAPAEPLQWHHTEEITHQLGPANCQLQEDRLNKRLVTTEARVLLQTMAPEDGTACTFSLACRLVLCTPDALGVSAACLMTAEEITLVRTVRPKSSMIYTLRKSCEPCLY